MKKWNASYKEGTDAENLYVNAFKKISDYSFKRHATISEDINEHWDLLFIKDSQELKIDVKAHRHKYRYGPLLEEFFVIEWKNVKGNKGWILGEADVIAYEYFDDFYTFSRNQLLNYSFMCVNFGKMFLIK
jgi:hypothetical protein